MTGSDDGAATTARQKRRSNNGERQGIPVRVRLQALQLTHALVLLGGARRYAGIRRRPFDATAGVRQPCAQGDGRRGRYGGGGVSVSFYLLVSDSSNPNQNR